MFFLFFGFLFFDVLTPPSPLPSGIRTGLQLSLLLLLGFKLDGAPGVAWWGVLLPAWALVALALVQVYLFDHA